MSIYDFTQKSNGFPLYIQLKQALIEDINNGMFDNMQKLPSRRILSRELNISTTTVNNAYQALVDEGYAMTIDRSGFYVKSNVVSIDEYTETSWEGEQNYLYNFSYNACDSDNLTDIFLREAEREFSLTSTDYLFGHGNKRGEINFRVALLKYLHSHRLIDCSVDDIFLGAGVQYLMTVITMILGPDKVYGFENPTDYKLYVWMKNLGLNIKLVDINTDGDFSVDDLDNLGIDVIFVMPENQLPTGKCMGKKQRRDLAQWCSGKTSEKYVIEIATDGNLRYSSKKDNTIYTMSGNHNVIYLDSFEYTLSSNIKTAFMVLPNGLIDTVIKKIETYSPLVTIIEQKIYQDMINNGTLTKIIKKNTKTMLEKRNYLIKRLQNSKLGNAIEFKNTETGMNLTGKLNSDCSGFELSKAAMRNGVKIFDMSNFILKPNTSIELNSFVFGYADLSLNDIKKAVENLEKAWFDKIK